MKFCKEHWEQLRQAVKDKGMWNLVSKSGQEVVKEMVKELKKEDHKFDPLMSAHNMMTAQALEHGGLSIMGVDDKGNQYCPLCEGEKHVKGLATDWIDGSTDECLAYCNKNGLLNVNSI